MTAEPKVSGRSFGDEEPVGGGGRKAVKNGIKKCRRKKERGVEIRRKERRFKCEGKR